MADIAAITFDCGDAASLAGFWAQALEREIADTASEHFALLKPATGSPPMMFIKVPEGKAAKNRVHLDLSAADPTAEVARLVGLGAEHVHDKAEWGVEWSTLRDPEGNEFCVSAPHN